MLMAYLETCVHYLGAYSAPKEIAQTPALTQLPPSLIHCNRTLVLNYYELFYYSATIKANILLKRTTWVYPLPPSVRSVRS